MLLCGPLEWERMDAMPSPGTLPEGPPPIWLALDEVQDPVSRPSQGLGYSVFGASGHSNKVQGPVNWHSSKGMLLVEPLDA